MSHCHIGSSRLTDGDVEGIVVLVGSPNVGKSAIFHRLTGRYAWVSNYPGTTVDINVGIAKIDGRKVRVIDTPGMYSLYALTEDEKIARRILFEVKPSVVVHVVDAKNIENQLGITLLLIEAGFNVILDLNAVDEAEKSGVKIDYKKLSSRLGIPVVATVATTGRGISRLKEEIAETLSRRGQSGRYRLTLGRSLESTISNIESMLKGKYPVSKRLISILLALGDSEIADIVSKTEKDYGKLLELMSKDHVGPGSSLRYVLEVALRREVERILEDAMVFSDVTSRSLSQRLSDLMISPVAGSIILILVLVAMYVFVGYLGAQVLVEFLEVDVFEGLINPAVNGFLEKYAPHPWIYQILGGEYGIITLGLKYAFAIILPIVTLFFIAFSIIEDSGYLPRLAVLVDKILKKIGLSGRAIIPLVLGTGCDTMATIVTRTLETRRERMLATLMLALGVPCSAQLGVIFGMLPDIKSLAVWSLVVGGVLLTVSFLASKVLPGENPFFIIELPPLRKPSLGNVLMKTWTRLEWYLREVIPLFVLASILIWAGKVTGLFDLAVSALAMPTSWIGLPRDAAVAFLYGFFRRDYGAAGFFDLRHQGLLDPRQTLVSMVTITLFVPCIAQFLVMGKERGWKYAILVVLLIIPLAFTVGYVLNLTIKTLGW